MIPSIASRLDILADIADQMEPNTKNHQQQLFFKYLIESIGKQQDTPIDFSTKQTELPLLTQPFTSHSSSSSNLLSSKAELLEQVYKRLQQVQESFIDNKQSNSIPPKKRYRSDTSSPDLQRTDNTYSERRQKNNEAAKRSRDARRVKEDEIAIKATWLEQENVKLRFENAHLKQENVQLRCQVYGSTGSS